MSKYQYQNIVVQNNIAAPANGVPVEGLDSDKYSTATFMVEEISGAPVYTLIPEITIDGTNWFAVELVNTSDGTTAANASAEGIYAFRIAGATGFRVRAATLAGGNITVTARASEVSHGFFSVGGGGGGSLPAIEVENPTGGERIVWFRTYEEVTVEEINAVLTGSGGQSVTFSVRYDSDRSAVGTELLTGGRVLTNITTGVSYVPDVDIIPAGVWVWIQTTAQLGTVTEIIITMDLA